MARKLPNSLALEARLRPADLIELQEHFEQIVYGTIRSSSERLVELFGALSTNDSDSEGERPVRKKTTAPAKKASTNPKPVKTPISTTPAYPAQIPSNAQASSSARLRCEHGEFCLRKSAEHRSTFSHPGDSDWSLEIESSVFPESLADTRKRKRSPSVEKVAQLSVTQQQRSSASVSSVSSVSSVPLFDDSGRRLTPQERLKRLKCETETHPPALSPIRASTHRVPPLTVSAPPIFDNLHFFLHRSIMVHGKFGEETKRLKSLIESRRGTVHSSCSDSVKFIVVHDEMEPSPQVEEVSLASNFLKPHRPKQSLRQLLNQSNPQACVVRHGFLEVSAQTGKLEDTEPYMLPQL